MDLNMSQFIKGVIVGLVFGVAVGAGFIIAALS